MKYDRIKDLVVSKICLGCWAAGKLGWGRVEDEEIIRGIEVGFELGINFIDTADIYGYGHSEKLVGIATKGKRDKFIIATKVGLNWPREKPASEINPARDVKRNLSRKYILYAVDESLQRLQTDYIDLYQAHWPDPTSPLEETAEAFEELCQKGKIRYWGVSNFSVDALKKLIKYPHFVSIQPPYNLLEKGIENDILPFSKENGIAVIVYSPMAMGLLTGKYKEEPKFGEFDWRNFNPFFRGEKFRKVKNAIQNSIFIAEKYGVGFGQIAIAWTLKKGVTSAIVGFKNEKQVRENVKSAEIELSDEEMRILEKNFSFKK